MQLQEVFIPFHRQQMFFLVVAVFAAGDQVALGALAAAGDRNDVIHGKFLGRCPAAAIVTNPLGQAAFPPLGIPQISGLLTLSFQVGGVQLKCKWVHVFLFRLC